MNIWFLYLLILTTIVISRVGVAYTSVWAALISMFLMIQAIRMLDIKLVKAKFFDIYTYIIFIVFIAILGISNESVNTMEEKLSMFIHICVSFILAIMACEGHRIEKRTYFKK